MKKIVSVLVPGAAAPAGINTLKSLKMANYSGKVIATDSKSLAAGFIMSDYYSVLPEADDPIFKNALFDIINKYNIQVLMPSSGFDIYQYSQHRGEISQLGAEAVVSDRESLEVCRDKLLTFQKLDGKFDLPHTTENPDKIQEFPVIAKPRFGKGSRDIIRVDNESDLCYIKSKFSEMIFQEYLPGIEYTVDVLSSLEKKSLMAVPRTRLETRGGISTQGKISRNSKVEETCMKIADSVGIRGPCCIQMKESVDGSLKLVEINPRMGGGTIFATLAGANFPSMIIEMAEGRKVNIPKISEVTIMRYFEEIVVDDTVLASSLSKQESARN
jgi:carbamoyl-phosphate synthase large subunit